MNTPLILTIAVLAVLAGYLLLSPLVLNLPRFLPRTWLRCPEKDTYGHVKLNAFTAAITAGYGFPSLRVLRCSLLGKGEHCREACLKNADL